MERARSNVSAFVCPTVSRSAADKGRRRSGPKRRRPTPDDTAPGSTPTLGGQLQRVVRPHAQTVGTKVSPSALDAGDDERGDAVAEHAGTMGLRERCPPLIGLFA